MNRSTEPAVIMAVVCKSIGVGESGGWWCIVNIAGCSSNPTSQDYNMISQPFGVKPQTPKAYLGVI